MGRSTIAFHENLERNAPPRPFGMCMEGNTSEMQACRVTLIALGAVLLLGVGLLMVKTMVPTGNLIDNIVVKLGFPSPSKSLMMLLVCSGIYATPLIPVSLVAILMCSGAGSMSPAEMHACFGFEEKKEDSGETHSAHLPYNPAALPLTPPGSRSSSGAPSEIDEYSSVTSD